MQCQWYTNEKRQETEGDEILKEKISQMLKWNPVILEMDSIKQNEMKKKVSKNILADQENNGS